MKNIAIKKTSTEGMSALIVLILFMTFLLTLVSSAFAQIIPQVSSQIKHYYEVELVYDVIYYNNEISGEQITYTSIEVIPSANKLNTPGTNYIAEITDLEDNTLNLTLFGIPTEVIYDIADHETGRIIGGGVRKLNHSEVILYLPYNGNAKEINIYDKNLRKKLSINVAEFSKIDIDRFVVEEGVKEIAEKEEKPEETPPRAEEEKLYEKKLLTVALLILGLAVLVFILFKLAIKWKSKR